jgi:hypothetical protein
MAFSVPLWVEIFGAAGQCARLSCVVRRLREEDDHRHADRIDVAAAVTSVDVERCQSRQPFHFFQS